MRADVAGVPLSLWRDSLPAGDPATRVIGPPSTDASSAPAGPRCCSTG